jgi:hypothetical protein
MIGVDTRKTRGRTRVGDWVQFGPDKFFWPMKGLYALFLRTGTRRSACKPPPLPLTPSRPSFADIVRRGKPSVGVTQGRKVMAGQGQGLANTGDLGARGGGRGAAYNPGF